MSEVLTAAVAAPVRWQAVLAVEGEPTEDGRMLAPGAITWRETPLPLMSLRETGAGGHEGAEVAGRIDEIWRDGSKLMGAGVFDSGEVGTETARLVRDQTLRGVSVDLAIREFEVQLLDEEGAPSGEAASSDALLDALSEGVDMLHVVTDGVIGMATVCPFQAIGNASIAITASADETQWTLAREDGSFSFPGPTIDDRIASALGTLEHVAEMRTRRSELSKWPAPAERRPGATGRERVETQNAEVDAGAEVGDARGDDRADRWNRPDRAGVEGGQLPDGGCSCDP